MTHSIRERLLALRTHSPRVFVAFPAILTLLRVANVVAAARLWRFRDDAARLRASMTETERNRTDLAIKSEDNRAKVVSELVRRQARADHELHLAIEVDSGRMFLERDGVALREIPIAVGPERVVSGAPEPTRVALSRGAQAVATLVGADDAWEVPVLVFEDRRIPVPTDRRTKGALGSNALLLNGGGVIYALPKDGPLADSTYVLPGAVLLRAEDLRAIAPNVVLGMTVYLYE